MPAFCFHAKLATQRRMDYNKRWLIMCDTHFREDGNLMTQTPVKQNPVMFYLRVLLYIVIALFARVLAFAPLYCLTLDSAWKWLWLLCPVLLIFGILPLRFSFAEAMVQVKGGRYFSFDKALSLSNYGEKLRESLLHALNVLKWGLPLAALGVFGYVWYNQIDAITVIRSITELGGAASEIWCKIYNFVGGLFGWAEKVPAAAALMEGLYVVLGVVALAVLIWLWGVVRNSATRYLWAIAAQNDRVPRAERRRRLKGRRFAQLLVALVNLVLLLPPFAVVALSLKDTVSGLSNQLMMVFAGNLPQLDLSGVFVPFVVAFFGLYLPLLPIRRWLTASFAARERKQKAKTSAAAQ